MNTQVAQPPAPEASPAEIIRLQRENSKLRKALERVQNEIFARYIPFDLQEEIRKALDS